MNVDSEIRKLKERHSPSNGKRVREEEISEEDARIIEEIDLDRVYEPRENSHPGSEPIPLFGP
jgi:hypothetical protein